MFLTLRLFFYHETLPFNSCSTRASHQIISSTRPPPTRLRRRQRPGSGGGPSGPGAVAAADAGSESHRSRPGSSERLRRLGEAQHWGGGCAAGKPTGSNRRICVYCKGKACVHVGLLKLCPSDVSIIAALSFQCRAPSKPRRCRCPGLDGGPPGPVTAAAADAEPVEQQHRPGSLAGRRRWARRS